MDDQDDPMKRVFALGKVAKLMRKFQDDIPGGHLDRNNKKLLKGFYTANKTEIEGDHNDAADRFGFQINTEKASRLLLQFDKKKTALLEERSNNSLYSDKSVKTNKVHPKQIT